MQAKETKLQDIIEGTKQYVLPLFQRSYSWDKKEWDILWSDLTELSEMESPRSHFIGSIVNMPTVSVPEGVNKYLLIDGQQRLTTVFIILAILRDQAKVEGDCNFADEINNTLLVNPYKSGMDYYKLLPTQIDRDDFYLMIQGNLDHQDSQIRRAYEYFSKKLIKQKIEPRIIKKIITNYLSIVSIVLDSDDNPYLVFESLNAKGRPLTQADLIRNYFFMRININEQQRIYNEFWHPMEERLGEKMTEFIRHYLMINGAFVRQTDIYHSLKDRVDVSNALSYLRDLAEKSCYYQKMIFPENEDNDLISKYFQRLNRIEVTTAYPLLLNIYTKYSLQELSSSEVVEILRTLENYLIRRFICSYPTNQLNKIFLSIIPVLAGKVSNDFVNSLKSHLQTKGYPKDVEFRQKVIDSKLYGNGDRAVKTKIILESVEESFGHKEVVQLEKMTIEHVMPQTITEWWQNHLGGDWESTYDLYIDNIGNLTLTAYNSELSNYDFYKKKEFYSDSNLQLNSYFTNVSTWKKQDIEDRSYFLAELLLKIWPYFGDEEISITNGPTVTGTTPQALWILGQFFRVGNWRDVLENTMNTIAELEPEKFDTLVNKFPAYIGKDPKRFRAVRELKNGNFIEVNLSAKSIQRLCFQALEAIDLSAEDWKVQTD